MHIDLTDYVALGLALILWFAAWAWMLWRRHVPLTLQRTFAIVSGSAAIAALAAPRGQWFLHSLRGPLLAWAVLAAWSGTVLALLRCTRPKVR